MGYILCQNKKNGDLKDDFFYCRFGKKILLTFIFGLLLLVPNVNAEEKNEVTLNFNSGIIHDGYVEYSGIGKIQLFKNDELVTDISNNMVIDLNETEYKFIIKKENTSSVTGTLPVRLKINEKYYYPSTTDESFNLDSSKFSGVLNIELIRASITVNTEVKSIYIDIKSTGVIDFTKNKQYVVDFSNENELTNGLKTFVEFGQTLYYKKVNDGLLLTEDEKEAIIKVIGSNDENKATFEILNTSNLKEETFKGLHMKYTGSKLQYDGIEDGVINETRYDYYTRCNYDFVFRYDNEYKVLEGANQTLRINKIKDLIIRIEASFDLFKTNGKVYINDELLDENNYTAKEGSTIITLKEDYLKTLSKGTYTLKVTFNDDRYAITNFFIKEEIKNPETSDNISNYIIISITSLLLGGVFIYNKNKLFEN